ncbi:hypothetical protein CDD83_6715 [Cordyceps sp. RAO-2017]|nr:hypothetical protein CDD83_6715 [Cordyceps sp. RAO-2017]
MVHNLQHHPHPLPPPLPLSSPGLALARRALPCSSHPCAGWCDRPSLTPPPVCLSLLSLSPFRPEPALLSLASSRARTRPRSLDLDRLTSLELDLSVGDSLTLTSHIPSHPLRALSVRL